MKVVPEPGLPESLAPGVSASEHVEERRPPDTGKLVGTCGPADVPPMTVTSGPDVAPFRPGAETMVDHDPGLSATSGMVTVSTTVADWLGPSGIVRVTTSPACPDI